MRVGIIADIHGNLVALETVLAALAGDRVERVVCLGDVAALGPQPAATLARLRDLGCPVVMGNTDAWLLDEPWRDRADDSSAPYMAVARWCAAQLSHEDREFLRSFPPTLTVPLGPGQDLLCFHGSPRSFDDVIAATTPDAGVAAMLGGRDAAIWVGGHTHVQLLRRWGAGQIVNVGSVGLPGVGPGTPDLPLNRDVRWAEYGVIEAGTDRLSIELRRVPLDLARVLDAARESGMPEYDWWRGLWGS